jgi:DNA-binding response OmpR family regulator
VTAAYDGPGALESARKDSPDLVVLDLMLPGVSGWDVCKELRRDSNIPVIMLTARDETAEKIIGLELGADDYITKPFDPKEVVSRIKAVLRRSECAQPPKSIINVGDISIDTQRRMVKRQGTPVELTPNEFELLRVLAESPGRVYTRMQLLDEMQGDAYEGYERTIDSHIKNLRKKIEPDPDKPAYIITVFGVGYKMGEV